MFLSQKEIGQASIQQHAFTSKWGSIPRESVDSWKHEDPPSPGCEGLLFIKDVTVLRSWSNFYFLTELFIGFEKNGINKKVTETSEEIPVASVGDRTTEKPVAKARPRPKPTFTLSLVSILYRERKWIDIESGPSSQGCFEVSRNLWSDHCNMTSQFIGMKMEQ